MKTNLGQVPQMMVCLGVGCLCLVPLSPVSAQEPKLRATLKGHMDRVASVAFSPNGKTLASGSYDGTIKLWNVATGKEQATPKRHFTLVDRLAYSPDGKPLVSRILDGKPLDLASYHTTIKLWDVATGK